MWGILTKIGLALFAGGGIGTSVFYSTRNRTTDENTSCFDGAKEYTVNILGKEATITFSDGPVNSEQNSEHQRIPCPYRRAQAK